MSRVPAARSSVPKGRPLVPLPPFRLEDRVVETLVAGDADDVGRPAGARRGGGDRGHARRARGADAAPARRVRRGQRQPGRHAGGRARVGRPVAAPGGRDGGWASASSSSRRRGPGRRPTPGCALAAAAGAGTCSEPTRTASRGRAGPPGWRERLATDMDLVAGRMVDRDGRGQPAAGVRLVLWLRWPRSRPRCPCPRTAGGGYRTRFRMMMGSNVGIRAVDLPRGRRVPALARSTRSTTIAC